MKFLVLALLVAVTTAAPLDAGNDPVELIVNGVPEGHPLEIGNIVDITLNEHADGDVVAQSNLLHPLTAVGLAEAAAATAQESKPEENTPESVPVIDATPDVPAVEVDPETPSVVDASPVAPVETPVVVEASPESPTVVDASPIAPEVPSVVDVAPEVPSIVDVAPEVPVIPVSPVDVIEVEAIPEPAAQESLNGEIYNDGMVQVQVNYPQEEGVIGTLKSWVSLALNYFQSGVPTSHQII